MALSLEIVDRENDLLIRTVRPKSVLRGSFSAIPIAIVLLIVMQPGHLVSMPLSIVFCMGIALIVFRHASRQDIHEIHISPRNILVRRPSYGVNAEPLEILPWQVHRLEYQPGGEDKNSGLFAVLNFRSVCLLPDLDERQSLRVADEVFRRFPDIEIGLHEPEGSMLFQDKLISLNLNHPEKS